jgi:hypothetical protein
MLDDLDRRLSEHARNHTPSTRRRGPWTLVHKEEFASLLEARRRELEIKRWKSARRYHGRGEMGDGAETGKLVMSRLRAQFAE